MRPFLISQPGPSAILATVIALALMLAVVAMLFFEPAPNRVGPGIPASAMPARPIAADEPEVVERRDDRNPIRTAAPSMIRGVVRTADGAAAAGVVVQALELPRQFGAMEGRGEWVSGRDALIEGRTDARGAFHLLVEPCRHYYVGTQPDGVRWVDGRLALAEDQVRLSVPRMVSSRVTVRRDGMPIDGVAVTVEAFPTMQSRVVQHTRSGVVEVESMPAGRTISVSALSDRFFASMAYAPESQSFESGVVLDLAPMTFVTGVIRGGPTAKPLGPETEVRQTWPGVRRTMVGYEGRFELGVLDAAPLALYCIAPGYATASVTLRGGILEWNPILELGQRIEGVVLDEDNQPVSGCRIEVWEDGLLQSDALRGFTVATRVGSSDSDGRFRIDGIGGVLGVVAHSRTLGMAAGTRVDSPTALVLHLKPCGGIEGTAGRRGLVHLRPLDEGAFGERWASPLENGRFAFADIPIGAYQIEFDTESRPIIVEAGRVLHVEF